MNIIDAHCHLQDSLISSKIDEILKNCQKNNIIKIINSATNINDWNDCLKISQKYNMVETALGIHPWFIDKNSMKDLENINLNLFSKSIAVGEIGLDKKNTKLSMENQVLIFEKQLVIAKKLDLPVIIHSVGTYNEVYNSVKKIGLSSRGGVIHAFNSSINVAKNFIDLGFYFSIGSIVTKQYSSKFYEALKYISPGYLLLESDSPYMPIANQDISFPEHLKTIIKKLAGIINLNEEKLAEITTNNTKKIFNIS